MITKSRVTHFLLAASFAAITSLSVSAQQLATRAATLPPVSNITTLYSSDPIAHSLCLTDGKEGGVIQNGGVFNRCSHVEFDSYKLGSLTVGIQGGETGRIVDLGTAADLSKQYGYQETVGNGQGFASIVYREGKVLIAKERYKEARQPLVQAAQLFENDQSVSSVEAKAGHIYLARIADRNNKEFQILVKILVLSARPGESVTFRWELI